MIPGKCSPSLINVKPRSESCPLFSRQHNGAVKVGLDRKDVGESYCKIIALDYFLLIKR